jgi:hypothetical protein
VMVTQVVPPITSHASMIVKFRKMLRRYQPSETPSSISLEGCVTAALLTEGLRRAGEELTNDTLIEALESIRDFDLGTGVRLRFSPTEHQASHKVWGILLDRYGRYRPVDLD